MGLCAANVRYWGVKRTGRFALQMSANDPKRTLSDIPPDRLLELLVASAVIAASMTQKRY
jgi:hypothetical protein